MNLTALVILEGCLQPIVAVRLADGRIGATLRSLCAAFFLEISGQRQRIQRSLSLRRALLPVTLDTDGGPQAMDVLLDWCVPMWLAGVNIKRLPAATQPIVLDFQQRAVFLLEHAFDTTSESPAPEPPPSLTEQFSQGLSLLSGSFTTLMTEHQDLQAEHEDLRREIHGDRQETRSQLAVMRQEQHNQALRLAALEARDARPTVGFSPQRLAHIYLLAQRVRAQHGYRIADTLAGLTDHFQVEDVSDLQEKDWPAVLTWFESLLLP